HGHAVRSGQQMPEGDVVRVPRVGSGAAGQGTEAGERSEPAGTLEQTTAADGGRWPGGRSVHHPVHLFVAGSDGPATAAPNRLDPSGLYCDDIYVVETGASTVDGANARPDPDTSRHAPADGCAATTGRPPPSRASIVEWSWFWAFRATTTRRRAKCHQRRPVAGAGPSPGSPGISCWPRPASCCRRRRRRPGSARCRARRTAWTG